MTRPGPLPDPSSARSKRTQASGGLIYVSSDGELIGPDLPSDREWGEITREFYDTWRRSPQARAFERTDWYVLLRMAVAWQAVYYPPSNKGPSSMMLAELRQHESKLGGSVEDRQRLKMVITQGEEFVPDDVSTLTDWSSRYKPKDTD